MKLFVCLLLCLAVVSVLSVHSDERSMYRGPFADSRLWVKDVHQEIDRDHMVTFTVALNLHNVDDMKREFLDVSIPSSSKYGRYLSLDEISRRYGPSPTERETVASYFRTIPGAKVTGVEDKGDFLTVTAPHWALEEHLQTKLSYRVNKQGLTSRRAVRADEAIHIPDHVASLISFVSLNSPVTHVYPRTGKALKDQQHQLQRGLVSEVESNTDSLPEQVIGVTAGNTEALLSFVAYCGDGSRNEANPPCSNYKDSASHPTGFSVSVTSHHNDVSSPYQLGTSPLSFDVSADSVYCYNSYSHSACNGFAGNNCTCLAKISPLPKYRQLKATVSQVYGRSAEKTQTLGSSSLFALTDVATASLLNGLYSIPAGMRADYRSNQSVVEFYEEFYSNSDLSAFLSLSGLPDASIPERNVLGDLPNDQSTPGGEAQLDVEYIMALAPGSDTFFYSFSDLNPNLPENEGFLAYLTYVSGEAHPPLVHSLSYGDVESEIFGTSVDDVDPAYGERCDLEFLKLGLRGISVIFSSGDDGIGNFIIRDDPATACSKAYPAWPASSPYVTSVGATQLTDQHLPACGQPYSTSSAYGELSASNQLLFECTDVKETVCSSTIGGVITSGGGFSDVYDRATEAPWQERAVQNYLGFVDSIPTTGYFNALGRGYPDVATYGSNYFVYLGGKVTRESGTSASAPVFAAMVTLWNSLRIQHGLPVLGFVAPLMYAIQEMHPSAFQDVTTGNNACGAGHSLDTVNCCEQSFGAVPGWDAVTGLGSPNFRVIANLILDPMLSNPTISTSNILDAHMHGITDKYDGPTGATLTSSSSSQSKTESTGSQIAVAGLVLGCVSCILASAGLYVALSRSSPKESGYSAVSNKETLLSNTN